MSPRRLTIFALLALVPVWVYALGVSGGLPVALASSICVLLIGASLYLMFAPHEEQAAGATEPGGL
jgi:hypothetical protein